ncbi:MAG: PhzF family phenazine biosynthesis protein [Actinobacteria bacterium]|nr:PhzF family phenazine biosynthesis protein [Actinomycetota bacterium]
MSSRRRTRAFRQIDVFTDEPYRGNPLAVVVDGTDLTTEEMQEFASWTNLSETTFLLPATDPSADYRVRIFTPVLELPFAGHPTLGSCRAWLEQGGVPQRADTIVQECGVGLVPIRRDGARLAFAAPPLRRSGPVDEATLDRLVAVLGVERSAVVDSAWIDNGPGWVGVMLGSVEEVLAVKPAFAPLDIGVVALHPAGSSFAVELRAFFPKDGVLVEDPVTGSLNASVAQWLLGSGRLRAPYVACQGGALGRAGRVHVSEADGEVRGGGDTVICIDGTVVL